MAGLDPATHSAPHHRAMCFGTVLSGWSLRLTNRVGGRVKPGHDDMELNCGPVLNVDGAEAQRRGRLVSLHLGTVWPRAASDRSLRRRAEAQPTFS